MSSVIPKVENIYRIEEIDPELMKKLIKKYRSKKLKRELGVQWHNRNRMLLDQFDNSINLPLFGDII